MERRKFFKKLSIILASIAGTAVGVSFVRIFLFNGMGRRLKIKLGKPSEYPVDTYTLIKDEDIFLYRDHEGLKAVSSVCTHLGCTVHRTADGFECPCHGSCFSDKGEVLSGPAPQPLNWYQVEKTPDGKVQVDMNSITDADQTFSLS